ncbi:transketolase [Kwoniella newhampshirensis]|uniref:transketolase n=1 Tax=Kwoniella newhampshirensis TaxID=1651941 RepID=A0AAW0YVQ9_9TREE
MAPSVVAADTAPGHSSGLKKSGNVTSKVSSEGDEMLVLNTVRCLAADLCQQYKGGHPGTVMGAAAIGVALWRYEMKFNPANPDWFARDRFVLSAGHACLLQYLMLHFSGYEAWTMDVIKQYHAPNLHGSMAAGHPEIEYPGVEVTTGPLGQGIANAVGLAAAGKQLAAQYNKDEFPVVDGKIWCFTGDGCLQEGVGQEAISMAGHWGLDNLIMIYDNNAVTVDGNIDACFTDDTSAKLKAVGWHVIEVEDGSNDLAAILKALDEAKTLKGKPVLVNIRTIIGFGSANQNSGPVHGAALGADDVEHVKKQLGFKPDEHFVIPPKVYDYFAEVKTEGAKLEAEWNDMMSKYKETYPTEAAELQRRMEGKLVDGWAATIPTKDKLPKDPIPTRKASGIMVQTLVPNDASFVAGSADLMESTFVNFKGQTEFQNPKLGNGDYSGRQIRYGIREFAMVAVGNGLAAYQKGMFIPIMSTFFMFWLYAAPAARMSALQKLRFIGIATHDAIGIGEDGPTHQPIALPSFYRALPNMNFIRPADAEEVAGAWLLALEDEDHPSLFALSRQPVPLLPGTDRTKIPLGAYIVQGSEDETPDLTLVASGAEVARAIETAILLPDYKVRVVSMPSQKHFDEQPSSYRRSVLPSNRSLVVAIEAWGAYGWARYAHAGCHMSTFGLSAPQAQLYENFGFSPKNMAEKIVAWAKPLRQKDGWDIPGVGEFEELLHNATEHHAG